MRGFHGISHIFQDLLSGSEETLSGFPYVLTGVNHIFIIQNLFDIVKICGACIADIIVIFILQPFLQTFYFISSADGRIDQNFVFSEKLQIFSAN